MVNEDAVRNDERNKTSEEGNSFELFKNFLRGWAIEFNVLQNSLKPLMRKINATFGAQLPLDPRTLLRMYYVLN